MAYTRSMDVISQRELRNDNATIVSRVEAGESFTVTRRGRPVADLVPHAQVLVTPSFVDAADVVNALAGLPPVDGDAWVRDAREVDEHVDDADRDAWASRG